jgi:hypothetical protein
VGREGKNSDGDEVRTWGAENILPVPQNTAVGVEANGARKKNEGMCWTAVPARPIRSAQHEHLDAGSDENFQPMAGACGSNFLT